MKIWLGGGRWGEVEERGRLREWGEWDLLLLFRIEVLIIVLIWWFYGIRDKSYAGCLCKCKATFLFMSTDLCHDDRLTFGQHGL